LELGNSLSWIRGWWNRTRALAWAGAAISAVIAIICVIAQISLTGATIFAIPLGLFLATIILPMALAGIVFTAAKLQALTDRLPETSNETPRN